MAWTIPDIFTAGTALAAAELNKIRDSLKAIGDPWTSYAPTWGASTTAPALGNGTLTGAYTQAGKLVTFKIRFVAGTTTTFGAGQWTFTLPVAATNAANSDCGGAAVIRDDSATSYLPATVRLAGSACDVVAPSGRVTASVPIAWANLDSLTIQGQYEAA